MVDIILTGFYIVAGWLFAGLLTSIFIDTNRTRLSDTEAAGVIIIWPIFLALAVVLGLASACRWLYECVRDALRLLTF